MKFGDVTADDLFKVAGSVAAINHTLTSAKDSAYKEEEREKVKGLGQDYGTMSRLAEAFPEVSPGNMSVSGLQVPDLASHTKSQVFADKGKADLGYLQQETARLKRKQNEFEAKFSNSSVADLHNMDWSKFGPDANIAMLAGGKVIKEKAAQTGDVQKLEQANYERGVAKYGELQDKLSGMKLLLDKGDTTGAGQVAARIIKEEVEPYRDLGVDEAGNVTHGMFENGELIGSQTSSPQEVYDYLKQFTQRKYADRFAAAQRNIRGINQENIGKYITMSKGGRMFQVFNFIDPEDGIAKTKVLTEDPELQKMYDGMPIQDVAASGVMIVKPKAGNPPTQKELDAKKVAVAENLATWAMSGSAGDPEVSNIPGVQPGLIGSWVDTFGEKALNDRLAGTGYALAYSPSESMEPEGLKGWIPFNETQKKQIIGITRVGEQPQGLRATPGHGNAQGVNMAALRGKHGAPQGGNPKPEPTPTPSVNIDPAMKAEAERYILGGAQRPGHIPEDVWTAVLQEVKGRGNFAGLKNAVSKMQGLQRIPQTEMWKNR